MSLNPAEQSVADWLGAVIPAVIGSAIGEFAKMKAKAEQESRPFYEIFCAEGGMALVQVVWDGGKAFLEQPIKEAMEARSAKDRKYWESLILSLWFKTAIVDATRVRTAREVLDPKVEVAWKAPVPKPPAGPDEAGRIGIMKLRPVASEANPPELAAPPKPTRTERKAVQKTPRTQRRPSSSEFTPSQHEAYMKMNSMEVSRNFAEFRNNPTPHYLCAHCKFLSPDRKFFRVDHVLEIQFGGTRDSWTPEQMRETYNKLKVYETFKKGFNGEVICDGCNQAKKTDGFPKEGKGYAYTKPDDDRNPVHDAQGGPDGKRYQNR
jgi:hypothetical protein